MFISNYSRVYSRHLLGSTFAANLLTWDSEKIFFLEMVKNGTCFGSVSKPFVPKNVSPKSTPASLSRKGPAFLSKHRPVKTYNEYK